MTTVNRLRKTNGAAEDNNLLINLNKGNNYGFQSDFITPTITFLSPPIKGNKLVRVLSNVECFCHVSFITANNYIYQGLDGNVTSPTFDKTILVGGNQHYFPCLDYISEVKVYLCPDIKSAIPTGSDQDGATVQLVFEFLEDLQPDLLVYNRINVDSKNIVKITLNQSNNYTYTQELSPSITNQRCVKFSSAYQFYMKANFLRTNQYYTTTSVTEGYLFEKMVYVGEEDQYYLVDNDISYILCQLSDPTLPFNNTTYEVVAEFLDYIPESLLEDRNSRMMVGPDQESAIEPLVLYYDTQNNTSDVTNIFLSLCQKYNKSDAYVYHKGFKVYLSIFKPLQILDNLVFIMFLRPRITIRFVADNTLAKAQWFLQNANQIPNVDVYYLPLNWVTPDLTYSDQSGLTRASNNAYFRVFSCGFNVITFCRGSGDSDTPDIFGNPQPLSFYSSPSGNIIPYKSGPNGQPLVPDTSQTIKLKSPASFRNLIVYPLQKPGNNLQFFEVINTLQPPADWQTNIVATAGGKLTNVKTSLQSYQYFQIDTVYQTQTDTYSVDDKSLAIAWNVPTPFPYTDIDCILGSTTPIMGNNVLFDLGSGFPLQLFEFTDLTRGHFDSLGNIVTSPGDVSYVFKMAIQDLHTFLPVIVFCDPLPNSVATWNINAGVEDRPVYFGLVPYSNLGTNGSYGYYGLQWNKRPNLDLDGRKNYFFTTPKSYISQWLMVKSDDDRAPWNMIMSKIGIPYLNTDMNFPRTVGNIRSDNYKYAVYMGHQFNGLYFELEPDRRNKVLNIPNNDPAQFNTNFIISQGNIFTRSSALFDDQPLSNSIKILPEGFQFRNYYQLKYLIHNTITISNPAALVWNYSTDNGLNIGISDPISLNNIQFGQLQIITGRLVSNFTGTNKGANVNTILYATLYSNTIYGQQLPIMLANEETIQYISHKVTSFNSISFTIKSEYELIEMIGNATILLYFLA